MRPVEEQQDRPQELLEADEDEGEGEDEIVLIGRSKGFAIRIFPTDSS